VTIETRMLQYVRGRHRRIVLREDLTGIGSAASLSRALRALQSRGVLVRIGMGIYAKTRVSSVTGRRVPAGSLEALSVEALNRLGVKVRPGRAAQAYNAGATTQLPGSFVVNTGSRRISRKITAGGRSLGLEHD
jgi:hypothetical protein